MDAAWRLFSPGLRITNRLSWLSRQLVEMQVPFWLIYSTFKLFFFHKMYSTSVLLVYFKFNGISALNRIAWFYWILTFKTLGRNCLEIPVSPYNRIIIKLEILIISRSGAVYLPIKWLLKKNLDYLNYNKIYRYLLRLII